MMQIEVRWGPIGSRWGPVGSDVVRLGPMGSDWVISHTRFMIVMGVCVNCTRRSVSICGYTTVHSLFKLGHDYTPPNFHRRHDS